MSAGAQTREARFSRFNQINLECSVGVGIPPMILHLIAMRLMINVSYSCTMSLCISLVSISQCSSSLISLFKAVKRSSLGSTFPPGNSHIFGMAICGDLSAQSISFCSFSMMAATTFMVFFKVVPPIRFCFVHHIMILDSVCRCRFLDFVQNWRFLVKGVELSDYG
jgi:hypothetical protein